MADLPNGTKVLLSHTMGASVQHIRVEVRRGPDKGLNTDLDAEPIRIGTSTGCHVQLTDSAVSGVHLEITRDSRGILLRDLGSTNGSFIDDNRIQGLYISKRTLVSLGESEIRLTPLNDQSPVELAADDQFGEMFGASVSMRACFAKLQKIAKADTTALITGETGTGKELAAAAIRDHSPRKDGPFVVVDCGAMPANLIESELLGHERGAFTGAERARKGAFERASGGTIFLDEIGELPLNLQPALLGILERREARRVGGQTPIPIDVRIIAATNRDLAAEVARGAFRADLYYRLAVVDVKMPALRERPDDIPLLIETFIQDLPGERPTLSKESIEQLKAYPWPGNVRELRNVIERAALLAEPPKPRGDIGQQSNATAGGENPNPLDVDIELPFKEQKNELIALFEQAYITQLIESTGGNIAAAARKARIDRMYVYKLLDRYQIEVPSRTKAGH